MDVEHTFYEKSRQINTAALTKSLPKTKRTAILQSTNRFRASLELVNQMLMLPSKLLALLHFERSLVFYDTKARILATLSEKDFQEQYEKHLDELMESQFLPEREKIMTQSVDVGKHMFADMLEHDDLGLRDTYEALLYSGIVWIWCIFEVLMRELWEYSLNKGGRYLGGAAIEALSSWDQRGGKVRSKYISLDQLAKYDYDLSQNLGTALLEKFDFTSCNGIRKAYDCVFPKSADIRNALSHQALDRLEATRHVIVHNAGIIDSAFCRRTQTDLAQAGTKLRLGNRDVSEDGGAVIDASVVIVLAILSNLAYASKGTQRT